MGKAGGNEGRNERASRASSIGDRHQMLVISRVSSGRRKVWHRQSRRQVSKAVPQRSFGPFKLRTLN